MATIRKRGSSWQAIVRRREFAESRTFLSKSDATAWATELEAKIIRNSAGLPDSPKNFTFVELVDDYMETSKKSPRGLKRTKENVLVRLKQELGHLPAQLTKNHINEFANRRMIEGISPATLNMDMIYIDAILKHARDMRDINIDLQPIQSVKKNLASNGNIGKSDQRDRRPTDEELASLFDYFDNDSGSNIPMSRIIKFAIATAMRQGEICKVKWADFNEAKSTLVIREGKNPNKSIDKTIPLVTNRGFDPLKLIAEQKLVSGNFERIFPYSKDTVSTTFTRACQKLGIIDLHFHDLRHEAVSQLFEQGFQIQHVRGISRHSDLKQLTRYTNTKPEDILRHEEKLKKSATSS